MAVVTDLAPSTSIDSAFRNGIGGMLRRRLTMNLRFCRRNRLVGGRIQTSQSM
jgi:hypothetical protein